MLAVDRLIGRTYESKSLVQYIVRTTNQQAYLVAWSEVAPRATYYAAVLGGGAPGGYIWDRERYLAAV